MGNNRFQFSTSHDAQIRDMWQAYTLAHIAGLVGCTHNQLYHRGTQVLGLPGRKGADGPPNVGGGGGSSDTREARRGQDEHFKRAMIRAMKSGKENPPKYGIDTRPGTKFPIVVQATAHGLTGTSPAAACAELG